MVLAAIVGSFLNIPEASAASLGGRCSRVGAVILQSSMTLKCAKVGKNLKWTKAFGQSTNGLLKKAINDGDICSTEGNQVTSDGRKYECRRVAGGQAKYFLITTNPQALPNQSSPSSLETCRLADFRSTNVSGQAVTYPTLSVSPMVRNVGSVQVGVVFIEYDDALSRAGEIAAHTEDVKLASRWFSWYSQGKVTYQLRIADRWVRAPRPSSMYVSNQHKRQHGEGGSQLMTDDELAAAYRDLARSAINMDGINVLWVVNPRSINAIDESFMYRDPAGPLIFSIGKDTYESRNFHGLTNGWPIWQQFVHETLHSHGLLGHAPKHEFFSLMNWNGSPGATINSWDAMILDWMRPENLYCVQRNELKKATLKLVPLEREQEGLRGVIVRLSESEALVIESHRRDQWSPRWPIGTYGVTIFRVDTRLDTDFNEGSSTSRYLMTDRKNALMVQGESFETDGVVVSFVASGDNDVIELSLAG